MDSKASVRVQDYQNVEKIAAIVKKPESICDERDFDIVHYSEMKFIFIDHAVNKDRKRGVYSVP